MNNTHIAKTIIMTIFRSIHAASAHPGRHWAARESSLEINRGHVLGLVLTLVLSACAQATPTTAPEEPEEVMTEEAAPEEPAEEPDSPRGNPPSDDEYTVAD